MAKRKSIIWQLTDIEFSKLVAKHNTIKDIIEELGLTIHGGNYTTLKNRIKADNIDIKHITEYTNKFTKTAIFKNTIPLEQILVEKSNYRGRGQQLKKRLIAANLLKDECYRCKLPPIWNNEPLVLQLEHINGNHTDNRIENLCILCPNCHTQTATFCGKQNKKRIRNCFDCGIAIHKGSFRCKNCSSAMTKLNLKQYITN